jgi:spore germination protein YaaH/flagellar hook assembly protein FlgD
VNRQTRAKRLRLHVSVALLIALIASGTLPGPGLAGGRSSDATPSSAALAATTVDADGALTGAVPTSDAASSPDADPATADAAADPAASGPPAPPSLQPSIVYEDWLAHEHDRLRFTPGGRVTVAFKPRTTDEWSIGGSAPQALPAGRASGTAMAETRQGSAWAAQGVVPVPSDEGTASVPDLAPYDAPSGIVPIQATPLSAEMPVPDSTAAPAAASGLRRQVFGFLPYWEVSGASTRLNYAVLTTIAYFSVGVDAAGNLQKRNANGSLTTGWAGWTSSSMTAVINAAHARGTRVVLTASSFAWTSGGAAQQRALLGSPTARANLARQIVAAVRDRGADGVNLDFEPLASGQAANFDALLKTLRSKFNAIRRGYQITYDTTGYIGNYPLEASVGPAAADAVFIMGYDYRTASASSSGSIDALSGPGYDLADTVREYTARISPSRVILGVPWYGRAWSTSTSAPRSANVSGERNGYSTAVNYENIPSLVARYGRKWDPVEQSPYVVYRRQNCTSTYGCVTSWRQLWYDDATSLGRRYQLVNDYGLRGAGIWALGFDGGHQELYQALSNAFLVDHAAPRAGIRMLPAQAPDEGIVVSWAAADVSGVRSYDVQVSVDGGAWKAWLSGTRATSDVWLGRNGHAYAFRVRATDVKGNVGAWNVTATAATAPTALRTGGFGRVTLDNLSYRTGPDTSAAKLGALRAGTIVALTSGPVSADGYAWFEVTEPVREWAPVSFVERGVWVAVRSSSATFVVPFHAPDATVVAAGIAGFGFGNGGQTGSSAAAVAGRTFSPNGDGSRDTLLLRWTARTAMGSLTLRVLRLDGSFIGSLAVPATGGGARAFAWNGHVNGRALPDGRYLLQLVGSAGSAVYYAPSARPATASQVAAFAVTVDTVKPVITSSSASTNLISPNGDGIRESASFALAATGGAVGWAVRVALGSAAPVRTIAGTGSSFRATWNGRNNAGAVVADGVYTVTLAACDVAGNCATRSYPVRVDRTPAKAALSAVPGLFSPNGDGSADTTSLRWSLSEAAGGTASVWNGATLVRRWPVGSALSGSVTWDGRNSAGRAVGDGRYTFKLDVRDAAGNRTVAGTAVVVDRTAGALRWSGNFYPQDGDGLAQTSTLSWRQTRTAASTLAIYDNQGNLVRPVWSNRTLGAGTRTWVWNGKLANGAYVPQGRYTARLTVVSSLGAQTLERPVWAAAFSASMSSTVVKPGQTLTVILATSEPLKGAPRVTFRQPGLSALAMTAVRLADGRYRAAFAVRNGATGVASVSIAGTDTGGRANASTYTLAFRAR